MKTNFDYEFKDENGNKIKLAGKDGAIFRDVAHMALLHAQGEWTPEEKRRRYDLAVAIKNFGSETELLESDVGLIKRAVGMTMVPLIVGPAFSLLEGKDAKE